MSLKLEAPITAMLVQSNLLGFLQKCMSDLPRRIDPLFPTGVTSALLQQDKIGYPCAFDNFVSASLQLPFASKGTVQHAMPVKDVSKKHPWQPYNLREPDGTFSAAARLPQWHAKRQAS